MTKTWESFSQVFVILHAIRDRLSGPAFPAGRSGFPKRNNPLAEQAFAD
jgi:hypothetical protein